jgi:hypothetical protein
MMVFIAMRPPRVCEFDLRRRSGKGNVTKAALFPTAGSPKKERRKPQSAASIARAGAIRLSARFCCALGRGVVRVGS